MKGNWRKNAFFEKKLEKGSQKNSFFLFDEKKNDFDLGRRGDGSVAS
jgi:hypothetical protein